LATVLSNRSLTGKIIYVFSILLSLAMITLVFSGLNEQQIHVYFNSDTLYLPSIFKDLFQDHSGFKGWHLNGAPNFFPDMLIYFTVNAIFPNFRMAMLIFSYLQYTLLLLLIRWLFRLISPAIREEELATGNLIMIVFFLATLVNGDFVFTFYLLSISYHMGAFIMTILSLALTIDYLRRPATMKLILLFFIGFLGVLNDKLFIAMYVLPLFSLVLFLLPAVTFRKKILLLFGNALAIIILGSLAYNGIKHSGYIHIISLSWKFLNFDNIPSSFHTMMDQHLTYLSSLDFRGLTDMLSIFSFIAIMVYAIRYLVKVFRISDNREEEVIPAIYLVFSTAFWIIVLTIPIINGSYVGYAILRYNVYAIYLSLFNFSILAMLVRKNIGYRPFSLLLSGTFTAAIFISAIFFFLQQKPQPHGIKRLINYYPPLVSKMDSVAKQENLRYGVATYWNAKYITMFSRCNLRVYTVYEDLTPWHHVMNENWYHYNGRSRFGNPAFTFVYMDALDSVKVVLKLGMPELILPFCNNSQIYIFKPFVFKRNNNPVYLDNL